MIYTLSVHDICETTVKPSPRYFFGLYLLRKYKKVRNFNDRLEEYYKRKIASGHND